MRESFPPVLYRYMERRFAEALVSKGRLRVGNLYSYRDIERLGVEIGDAAEGTLLTIDTSTHKAGDPTPLSWVAQKYFAGPPEAYELYGNVIEHKQESPNVYVCCTALEWSPEVMERMSRSLERAGLPAYDTVVRIDDPEGFHRGIHRALLEVEPDLGPGRAGRCQYVGRRRSSADEQFHPARIKEPSFAYQREFRGWWECSPSNARPFRDVQSARIASSCRIVDAWAPLSDPSVKPNKRRKT